MIWYFLFLLGICVGSFLNCLVYRLNHNLSLLGRSVCPKCKHKIEWRDNIPLLSFVLLGGRCRYCQKKISLHYPLVELATGVLTVFSIQYLVLRESSLLNTIYYILLTYCLIAIFLSDLLYQTVPDEIVYPAIVIAILFHLRGVPSGHLAGVLGSGLSAAAFFLALVFITRGRGMGLGDVKLATLMGLFLGYPKIIVAFYLAFLTGGFVGAILVLLKKKKFGEHIPFGPFLTTATIISLFWGETIWKKGMALLLSNF